MPITQFYRLVSQKPALLIASLLFMLPLIGLFMPASIQHFYAEWFAGLIGIALTASLINKQAWQSMHLPQTAVIILGLVLIVMVQWMLGMLHSKHYAVMVLSYLLVAGMLATIGTHLRRQYGWASVAQYIAYASLVGGSLVAVLVALQVWGILPASAIQPVQLLVFLSMALISAVYLMAKQLLNNLAGLSLSVLMLSAMAILAPTLGWLMVIVIASLMVAQQILAIRNQNGNRQRRSLVRMALMFIPIYALLRLLAPAVWQAPLPSDMLSSVLPVSATAQAYWDIWKTSWQMFTASPWLGVGVGNVAWQSYLLTTAPVPKGEVGVFSHAHQQWLQTLVELGAGGLLMLALGTLGWLINYRWQRTTLESWWLVGMVLVILAAGLIDTPLANAHLLLPFALLLGIGEEKTTEVKSPKLGYFATTAYTTCFGVLLASTLLAHHKINVATPLALKNKLSVAEETTLHQSLAWVHNNSLLQPYAQLLFAKGVRINSTAADAKLWLNNAALRFQPNQTLAYQHVMLLKLAGDHARAVAYLKISLNAYPASIIQQLQLFPLRHFQEYLDVLSEAKPIKKKNNNNNNPSISKQSI